MASRPLRFGLVASRFNREITDRLVEGAIQFFLSQGISRKRIDLVWVAGAFELPAAALRIARSKKVQAIVAVGCIVAGETPHFLFLSQAALHGLMTAGLLTGVPVTSGLITAKTWRQAVERSQKRGMNRGREAAEAAWGLVSTHAG